MLVSRVVFWGSSSLFAVLLLFVLGTNGCRPKPLLVKRPQGTRIVPCATKIDVDVNTGVSNPHQAIYVCEDTGYDQVTWTIPPLSGVKSFTVTFPPGHCPFNPCPDFTEKNPTGTVASALLLPPNLTVYKYKITVNGGPPIDPHVVAGGGF